MSSSNFSHTQNRHTQNRESQKREYNNNSLKSNNLYKNNSIATAANPKKKEMDVMRLEILNRNQILEKIQVDQEIPVEFCTNKKVMQEVIDLVTEEEPKRKNELEQASLELIKISIFEMLTENKKIQ